MEHAAARGDCSLVRFRTAPTPTPFANASMRPSRTYAHASRTFAHATRGTLLLQGLYSQENRELSGWGDKDGGLEQIEAAVRSSLAPTHENAVLFHRVGRETLTFRNYEIGNGTIT